MVENSGLVAAVETVLETLHTERGNAILLALNDQLKRKLFWRSIHSISVDEKGKNLESNKKYHHTMAPELFELVRT
jgi:hypothetical protein